MTAHGERSAERHALDPRVDAVSVLFLEGTLEARAAQFGEAMRTRWAFAPALPHHLASLSQRALSMRLPKASGIALKNARRLFQHTLLHPVMRGMPPAYHRALEVMADASGVPKPRLLVDAHGAFDALGVLFALPLFSRGPAFALGCASLIATDGLTGGRGVMHGRSLELSLLPENRAPLLCVHRPRRGHAHVSLHSLDAFMPGFTAVNAAGLTLAVHRAYAKGSDPRGRAILPLAQDLIERCANVRDVGRALADVKTCAGWIVVVSDQERGRAAAYELTAEGSAPLFPPRDFLAVSNCLRTRQKVHDFAPSGAIRERAWSRLSRLNAHARRGRAHFDTSRMLKAMTDVDDGYAPGEKRAFGNTVGSLDTVDAVVFAPADDAVVVAVGEGPRHLSTTTERFSLAALLAGRVERTRDTHLVDLVPEAIEAARAHARAAAAREQGARDRWAQGVKEAHALFADEPLHTFAHALACFEEGAVWEASERFDEVLEHETSPYRRGLARLMQGRALSVLGHRREAQAAYKEVAVEAEDVDPGLKRRAERERVRGFSGARLEQLVVDPWLVDVWT